MKCSDFNIKNCFYCRLNSVRNDNAFDCDIDLFISILNKNVNNEKIKETIISMLKFTDAADQLKAAVSYSCPAYSGWLEKILVLK